MSISAHTTTAFIHILCMLFCFEDISNVCRDIKLIFKPSGKFNSSLLIEPTYRSIIVDVKISFKPTTRTKMTSW